MGPVGPTWAGLCSQTHGTVKVKRTQDQHVLAVSILKGGGVTILLKYSYRDLAHSQPGRLYQDDAHSSSAIKQDTIINT